MNGKREVARRRRQIETGHVRPSMLRADDEIGFKCADAVGRGAHDGEVDAATYDALEEILGRVVVQTRQMPRPIVCNFRYMKPGETRDHLMCKGRVLYRGAA